MNDCPGEATEDSNLIRKKKRNVQIYFTFGALVKFFLVTFEIDRNRLLFLRHHIMLLDATASL